MWGLIKLFCLENMFSYLWTEKLLLIIWRFHCSYCFKKGKWKAWERRVKFRCDIPSNSKICCSNINLKFCSGVHMNVCVKLMCHYSQTDPSAGSRHIRQFWTFCACVCTYVLINEPESSCGYMNAACACMCVFRVCAEFATMCTQACTVVACVRKQRQTPSVSLSASCSGDWCGRKHSDGCRGTTHPWKTN